MALTPLHDCPLCPRLAAFREKNRAQFPLMFNGPVPSFGAQDPDLLIVGLAPGLRGANFTGRPFTNDYAGDTLFPALLRHGFARGNYDRHAGDGLELVGARIVNSVRCVPPENKPTPLEINTCRPFLQAELKEFTRLKVIVALGTVAHGSLLKSFGLSAGARKFGHAARHELPGTSAVLIDSYHCSRYNVNTGRLTEEMFDQVIATARDLCGPVRAAAS